MNINNIPCDTALIFQNIFFKNDACINILLSTSLRFFLNQLDFIEHSYLVFKSKCTTDKILKVMLVITIIANTYI